MKKADVDRKVGELMAKGFSKTKSTQALKDAGNNMAVALRVLERQTQNESQHAPPRSGGATPGTSQNQTRCDGDSCSSSAAALIPSLRRARGGTDSTVPLTAEQKKLQRLCKQRHPCVAQYGCCCFGDFCLLKDFPGDVCVQYFQGCCIYGSCCRHRHCVDGVDVREVLRATEAEAASRQIVNKGDAAYRVQDGDVDAKVRVATLVEREVDRQDATDDAAARSAQGLGAHSHFGHLQWHADPFQPGGSVNQEEGESIDGDDDFNDGRGQNAAVHHPTPFLDRARAGAASASKDHTYPTTRNNDSNDPVVTAPLASARAPPETAAAAAVVLGGSSARPPRRRHPCIAQYGSCKYGDACLHADRDADVCVRFLQDRCRFSAAECRYRHESAEEYHQASLARAGLSGAPQSSNNETKPMGTSSSMPTAINSASGHATRSKNRLQGIGMMGGDGGGCGGGRTGRADTTSSLAPTPLPASDGLNAFTAASSGEDSQMDVPEANTETPLRDAEMLVFLGLLEVYPSVEPSVVLQTLRLCGGDPVKASDMIGQFSSSTVAAEVDHLAAVLAVAAAEEAAQREAAEAAAQHARVMERHNSLLTLAMLFPSVEVSAVEAVLSQQKQDFGAAYSVLLCTQEKMARAALWKGSTALLSPADQLRVEKLHAMFRGLHPDIVRSAFCATGHNWSSTTTALNELTKELLSLEAVEVPTGPVVWHPPTSHAAATTEKSGNGSSCSPGPAGPTVETSAEAYEAYRAAEKEILGYGDWRQVRQQAYLLNSQRIRVLGQASAAFHQGDGSMAKLLSREGHRMAVEYNRLNRMAMLALEQERLRTDAMSMLDLHGFHTAEVHDVVVRRVDVCQRKRIGQLRIVVGECLHSKRNHVSIYTVLMEELSTDAYLKLATKVKSVKAGYVDVVVKLPVRDS